MNKEFFITAELSANHGHNIEIAKKSIIAAKEAGADAIKLQTYTADTLTINCDNKYFQLDSGTIWDGRILYDLYKEAYTPWEWHDELFSLAKDIGIKCFSTPFDNSAVEFLEKYNMPYMKIASFEIVDTPLIEYAARLKIPMVISTGIATLENIDDAVNACLKAGNSDITLLKCTSSYPAKIEDANLLDIPFIKERYNVKVGLSDHTLGDTAATVAVGLGATFFEKHFILDKSIGGVDSSFSVDKEGLTSYVNSIRLAEKSLGKQEVNFNNEKNPSRQFARSLFVVEDIEKGEVFTKTNIRSIRPGYGIAPKHIDDIVGRKANKSIRVGTPLSWDLVE